MKRTIIITAIVVLGIKLFGQNDLDHVLEEVEKNNTTLSALRMSVDAEKTGNKTGIMPQNPEVELNYLFGNSAAMGNLTDFSIKQSFDHPKVYSYKNQISDLKNERAELEFKKQHIDLLYQTRVVCVKLTYYNALKVALNKRYANALKVAEAYTSKYNTGDAGILDYNKAQVNLLNISKELENNEIEQNALLSELATLNGGNAINFTDSLFSLQSIPFDFEQWYALAEANNQLLQWVKQEIAITEKQVQLNTAYNLPRFYGGYMSEKVGDEHFRGITVGVTIPLWENKNTVQYAKARTIALQSVEADTKLQFYNNMKKLHTTVISLLNMVNDFRSKLALYSNSELLEKAFTKGEISLTEYMYELSLYYESVYKLLEVELKLNVAYAELIRYQ